MSLFTPDFTLLIVTLKKEEQTKLSEFSGNLKLKYLFLSSTTFFQNYTTLLEK